MTLTLNKPYLVKRVANKSGTLHYLPLDGFCDPPVIDRPYLAKRVANKSGVMHYLISDQKLEADGTLKLNKPYLAKRVANKDGVLHYLIGGKQCDVPANHIVCECEICCTLTATVSVNNGSDAWTEPLGIELTCGGVIEFQSGHCCLNDEIEDDFICFSYTNTFAEKNTFGAAEAYNWITTSGTIEQNTKIWASGNFTIGSYTYRLSYWRTERSIHQTSPTTLELDDCNEGWVLQKLATDETFGDYWLLVDSDYNGGSNVYGAWVAATTVTPSIFDVSNDNPYSPEDCPVGYSYSGGDLSTGYGCATYQSAPPYGFRENYIMSVCPVLLWSESYSSSVGSPTCEQRIPCTRVFIADRCNDRLSCDLETMLSGGITTTLDWDITGCHSSSGSQEWVGTACSEFWMFNAGTGGLGWEGADTTFDTGDSVGPEFAAFCDAEEVVWIDTGTRYGRIEAALCCVTPLVGDPYIAAYARLEYNCFEDIPPLTGCGGSYYGYKTRDLAITMVDGEIIVSFTGLMPFSSYTPVADPCPCSSCICECDPAPSLSLAWRIKLSEC